MKEYRYNEPKFIVVEVNTQDIITTSNEIPNGSSGWETGGGSGGSGIPIISL